MALLVEKVERVVGGSEERHAAVGHEQELVEHVVKVGRRLVDGADDGGAPRGE